MNAPEFILALVALIIAGRTVRSFLDGRARSAPRIDAEIAAEATLLRREVQALKDRIAVLERLATDDNNAVRLDREIEKLRDNR